MNRIVHAMVAVVGAAALAGAALGQSTDKPAAAQPAAPAKPSNPSQPPQGKPDEEAMDLHASQPAAEHQRLAKMVGQFTSESTLTIAPGQPGTKSTGRATLSMILGGRFLQIQESGELKAEISGQAMSMPYESVKMLGFNNGSRKYESSWLWSNETSIMSMKGQSKDEGKTVECQATFDNEVGAAETLSVTFTFTDPDHFSTLIKATDGPTMETVYTRKPGGDGAATKASP